MKKHLPPLVGLFAILSFFLCLYLWPIGIAQAQERYSVQEGDSLWKISQRFTVRPEIVQAINKLPNIIIIPGQVLFLHWPEHRVSSGESLWIISQKTGTSVEDLVSLNKLDNQTLMPDEDLRYYPVTGSKTYLNDGQAVAKNVSVKASTAQAQENVYWLSRIIHAEAQGEPFEGQIAVGSAILNRVESPDFENTIKEVIFSKAWGHYQFSPVENGTIYQTPSSSSIQAAHQALSGVDPTKGAVYFYNPEKTKNAFLLSRPITTQIGSHVFTR